MAIFPTYAHRGSLHSMTGKAHRKSDFALFRLLVGGESFTYSHSASRLSTANGIAVRACGIASG
jgi:hypothetical protein